MFLKHFDSRKLKNIYRDVNGYFVNLTLNINSVSIVLCNLYAPNVDDLDFFITLTVHIDTIELENIIMGAVFNLMVTNSLDCLNRHSNNWKVRTHSVDCTENNCLVDVFRFMNPESRIYTWPRRTPNLVASRLDLFLDTTSFFAVNPSYLY